MTQIKTGQLRKFHNNVDPYSNKLFVVIDYLKNEKTLILMDNVLINYDPGTADFFVYKSEVLV